MDSTPRRIFFSVGATALLVASATFGCQATRGGMNETLGPEPVAQAAISQVRIELLERAFAVASAIPVAPHIKDRSRCQEAVVVTCLELDRPDLAARYVDRIENWRRGSAYADLASHCAGRGMVADAERYLALAATVADSAEDWRKDRVKEKIARSSALLAVAKAKAADDSAREADSKTPAIASSAKAVLDRAEIERRLSEVGPIAEKGNFDQIRVALYACAALYDEVYADEANRKLVDQTIESSWGKVPVTVRIDVLSMLAGSALRHQDQMTARSILTRAEALMNGADWLPEDRIPVVARLALMRHRAGETDLAKSAAEGALALFRAERERMINIDRADALRPLAEAVFEISGATAAMEIYRLAVEEGVANPNSRPRAEDLALTCASMARVGLEPDEQLSIRITAIAGGLSDPW
ncbi:MAG: hypothetical protein JNL80_11025 [Phycisphaerae bacterium]|jgi:hypothetical protein|nr:hypothetical protein [Phycisphaerae bacterium]